MATTGDRRAQLIVSAIRRYAARQPTTPLGLLALHKTESKLTDSLVGGGHEGGSGSNEEGEEEEGTHLGRVLLGFGV